MGDFNQTILCGRLGADPEIRAGQSGDKIARMRIATSERWTDKRSGERRERTEWHHIVVFSPGLAGVVEKYLRKGDQVLVQGQLRTREWNKDGEKRFTTEVVLDGFSGSLQLLGGSRGQRGGDAPDDAAPMSAGREAGHDAVDADEIPF